MPCINTHQKLLVLSTLPHASAAMLPSLKPHWKTYSSVALTCRIPACMVQVTGNKELWQFAQLNLIHGGNQYKGRI